VLWHSRAASVVGRTAGTGKGDTIPTQWERSVGKIKRLEELGGGWVENVWEIEPKPTKNGKITKGKVVPVLSY
jgi:hypothetical protein